MFHLTRRTFLKFSAASALFPAISTTAAFKDIPVNTGEPLANKALMNPSANRASLMVTLLDDDTAAQDRVLIANESGDWVVLGEIEPVLLTTGDRVFDLASVFAQGRLVIPPHEICIREVTAVPAWQVTSVNRMVKTNYAEPLPLMVTDWASENGGVVQKLQLA